MLGLEKKTLQKYERANKTVVVVEEQEEQYSIKVSYSFPFTERKTVWP